MVLDLYHYWLVSAYFPVAGAPVLQPFIPAFPDSLHPIQQDGPVSLIKDIKRSHLHTHQLTMLIDGMDQKAPNIPTPTPMSGLRTQVNPAIM